MGIRFGGRRRLRTGAEPRRSGSSWENGKVLWGGRPPGERDEEKKINRRRRWRRQVWSVCLLEWEQAGGWGRTRTERKGQGRTRQRQAGAGADRVRLKRPAGVGPRERDCGGKGRSLWGRANGIVVGKAGRGGAGANGAGRSRRPPPGERDRGAHGAGAEQAGANGAGAGANGAGAGADRNRPSRKGRAQGRALRPTLTSQRGAGECDKRSRA